MPALLHRSGTRVQSVFGLHGTDENDLSAAFAFGISRSLGLLRAVLQDVAPEYANQCEMATVHIQTARSSAGITDVEIRLGDKAVVVFEAKKGPEYPTQAQLAKYVAGCQASGFGKVKMVALTSREPVPGGTPPDWVKIGAPACARSWRRVADWSAEPSARKTHLRRGPCCPNCFPFWRNSWDSNAHTPISSIRSCSRAGTRMAGRPVGSTSLRSTTGTSIRSIAEDGRLRRKQSQRWQIGVGDFRNRPYAVEAWGHTENIVLAVNGWRPWSPSCRNSWTERWHESRIWRAKAHV